MDTHSFQRTRITLTAWYVAILAVILFSFSVVLYTGQQRDFVRIIVQRDFNSRVPHILTPSEEDDVQRQLIAIRGAFLLNLIIVDGIVLLLGGTLSYFLAGITLAPIRTTFLKQKEFLADVSHEIRTPLAAIQTATEVSLRSKKRTGEEYRRVVEQVYEQSKRLTKMANDLLLLSRMESGNGTSFKSVSLTKITKEAVSALHTVAEERHIVLTAEYHNTVSLTGDANSLMQLIMIFLDNAIKYTNKNGTVRIVVTKDPRPILIISDTGLGISEEDQKKIFERFYQADRSRASLGNGLGLAIAQEILAKHKAKVSLKSEMGKGSTFTITFS